MCLLRAASSGLPLRRAALHRAERERHRNRRGRALPFARVPVPLPFVAIERGPPAICLSAHRHELRAPGRGCPSTKSMTEGPRPLTISPTVAHLAKTGCSRRRRRLGSRARGGVPASLGLNFLRITLLLFSNRTTTTYTLSFSSPFFFFSFFSIPGPTFVARSPRVFALFSAIQRAAKCDWASGSPRPIHRSSSTLGRPSAKGSRL